MDDRPGCLSGILKLLLLNWVFDWLQDNFGFGRGCSGCGCGVIFMVVFVLLALSIITGTDWLQFGF